MEWLWKEAHFGMGDRIRRPDIENVTKRLRFLRLKVYISLG